MRTIRATALAVAGIIIIVAGACSESPTTQASAVGPSHQYAAGNMNWQGFNHDTIYATTLVIKFSDGNEFKFSSTGTGVLLSAKVDGHVTNIAFSGTEQVSVGATEFLAATTGLGFFNSTPSSVGTITGSRSSGVALNQLLTTLDDYGLVNNSSTQ